MSEETLSPATAPSLKERIAERRRQLEQEHTFVLPVPGYGDVGLAARYRALPYETLRKIGRKPDIQQMGDTPEGELAVFADTLINSCVELLEEVGEEHGRPVYRSLGHAWTADGVRGSLGVDVIDGGTARDAVFAVFTGQTGGVRLAHHADAWNSEQERIGEPLARSVEGESEPSEEG